MELTLDTQFGAIYFNRGECWLHLKGWENAKEDFMTATNMGIDIIEAFHNEYKNAKDFKEKTDIELPPDLAKMLGG